MPHTIVHPADIQDRDGGVLVLSTLFGAYPFLLKLDTALPESRPLRPAHVDRRDGRQARPRSAPPQAKPSLEYRAQAWNRSCAKTPIFKSSGMSFARSSQP
jgi:hypothetical protein